MALKNYYLALGIEREEGPEGIRSAFRALARRYHPDRAGPDATRAFQEVQEAYQVLSDADARRNYDSRLQDESRLTSSMQTGVPSNEERPHRHAGEPEPLIPETMSLARDFRIRPSREAMLDRFLHNFVETRRPKSEAVQSMNVEVVIPPEDAELGGLVTVGVPVFVGCPACAGTGRVWLYRCEYCWGEGLVEAERPVRVHVPPFVSNGTVIEIPLGGLGIHNFYLRVVIRVGR